MPSERPGEGTIDPTPGLAGGPGPAPPGVEDGAPEVRPAVPETIGPGPPADKPPKEVGEAAERIAGARRAEEPGAG